MAAGTLVTLGHPPGDLYLFRRGQQRDFADLVEVEAHRIVNGDLGQVLEGPRQLLGAWWCRLVPFGLRRILVGDDLDTGFLNALVQRVQVGWGGGR